MRYTDQQLRDFARQVIEVDAEDPDFLGVAEQFEEQWKDLPIAEFEEVHRAVHDLACSASVTVAFPGEQTNAPAVPVERLAEILWNARKRALGDSDDDQPFVGVSARLRTQYERQAAAVLELLGQDGAAS